MSTATYVKRAELLAACRAAKAIAPTDATHPALHNARLTFAADKLTIFATDLAREVLRPVAVDGHSPVVGVLYAPIRELTNAVAKMAGETVGITTPRGKVVLRSERTEVRVSCSHESVMPSGIDFTPPESGAIIVAVADLALAIRRTSYAIYKPAGRFGLDGLCIERVDGGGDRLRLIGCDGHRLSWAELACRGGGELPRARLLPPDLLTAVLRGADDDGDIEISFAEGRARFTRPAETLTGLLFEGVFPDYRAAIPTGEQRHSVLVDRAALLAALGRQPRGTPARWEIHEDGIRLETLSKGFDLVEVSDEVAAEVTGGDLTFGMLTANAIECLMAYGGEKVRLRTNHALAPILIEEPENELQSAILMPRRLD